MKVFVYEIKDSVGVHARPAGMLVKEAMKYDSRISIKTENKSVEATKLMALMALGIKQGQRIEVEIEGADEEKAYEGIKAFFEQNL
ncbi:MAG: HPr family phosphocarrier protein [Lachnospiraceae bacterium]|nr:HPr family phosphocarrier protein [Lachnospiraceae bacterium]